MKKEIKSKIYLLMKKYNKRAENTKRKQEQIELEHKALLNSFKNIKKNIILSSMQYIGNYVKEHGHEYQIIEEEESVGFHGETRPAKITMNIYPGGNLSAYPSNRTPSISFYLSKQQKLIFTNYCTLMPDKGGSISSGDSYNLEEITKDIVEKEILKLLEEVFDPKF